MSEVKINAESKPKRKVRRAFAEGMKRTKPPQEKVHSPANTAREKVELVFGACGMETTLEVGTESIELFGSAEELALVVRKNAEAAIKSLAGVKNNEDFDLTKAELASEHKAIQAIRGSFERFIENQVRKTIKERPLELSYNAYLEWTEKNEIKPIEKHFFPRETGIFGSPEGRFAHILEKEFEKNSKVVEIGGTQITSSFLIKSISNDGFLTLTDGKGKEFTIKDPRKYKRLDADKKEGKKSKGK